MIDRYPYNSIIFGASSELGLEDNQVFEFFDDTLFRHGEISVLTETQKYKHNVPPERLIKFPAEYNSSWEVAFLETDTTYENGTPTNIESVNRVQSTIIDGYGTLIVSGYNFECLRMKRTHAIPLPAYKEYWYLTQEGALLVVNGAASEPDTGIVQIKSIVLFLEESLLTIPETSQTPLNCSLNQNYPNPFNPITNIEYRIPNSEVVTLKIYNLIGQEVATLVSENQNAGNHSYQFDGKNLASGIYYYQLVAGDFMEVKKMILLR